MTKNISLNQMDETTVAAVRKRSNIRDFLWLLCFVNPQTKSGGCEATVGLYGKWTDSDGHWPKVWLKDG